MTNPAAAPDPWVPFVLGVWPARWVWMVTDPTDGPRARVGSTPAGVELDHGDHRMLVAWVPTEGGPGQPFTVESLLPLTVVEPVTCGMCRTTGRIVAGVWMPTEGVEA